MKFLQRDQDGVADIAFDGERARLWKNGEVLRDWSETGSFEDVPQGGGYTLETIRDGESTLERVDIGIIVGTIGQSNISLWYDGKNAVAAAPDTYLLGKDGWGAITGEGAQIFANTLSAATGVPVALVDGALGGTRLLPTEESSRPYWLQDGPGTFYDQFHERLAIVGGRAEIVLWSQGESDARQNVSEADYAAGLREFLARVEKDFAPTAILLPELGGRFEDLPGRPAFFTEEAANSIRDAQKAVAAEFANVLTVNTLDLELADIVHRTQVSFATEAIRLIDAYLHKVGGAVELALAHGTDDADSVLLATGTLLYEAGAGDDVIEGTQDNDIIRGQAGADRIAGHDGSDLLSGGDGDDVLEGGGGRDRLHGDAGDDQLDGGADGDLLYGGEGKDTLLGGSGDDVLLGQYGDDRIDGGDGNDWIEGGAGNDVLDGGDGNDVFTYWSNNGGSDRIDGGGGFDTIRVVINDTIIGIASISNVELISAAASNVVISGTAGDDVLDFTGIELDGIAAIGGGDGNDTITGSVGNDVFRADRGNDVLNGGAGDDVFLFSSANTGVDTINGGDGQDEIRASCDNAVARLRAFNGIETISANGFADFQVMGTTQSETLDFRSMQLIGVSKIDAGGGRDRVYGTDGADTIDGNADSDSLYGYGGNDTLIGGTGDDFLDGGSGADQMAGGAGDDSYVVDNGGDVVTELAGEGIDKVTSSVTYALSAEVENLTLTGSKAINATGNDLANTIIGNNAANILVGNAGEDRLDGGLGVDKMYGGLDDDTYVVRDAGDLVIEYSNGGTDKVEAYVSYTLTVNVENLTLAGTAAIDGTGTSLANTITGNDADNTLSGGRGDDTLIGNGGNDTLLGGDGSDMLTGGAGDDRLDGGAGHDKMYGGMGDDTYVVDNPFEQVVEVAGEGIDTVEASVSVKLSANVENLVLTGTAASTGTGNTLANVITGNSGDNRIDGGLGNDVLTGGAGKDMFVFSTALNAKSNADTITDFSHGDDAIWLNGRVFSALAPDALTESQFVLGTKAVKADQHIVYDQSTGRLYYDADGSGSAAQTLIATLANKAALTFDDFLVG